MQQRQTPTHQNHSEAAKAVEPLITAKEGADRAAVSLRTWQAWTYGKKIPSVKIGRTRRWIWSDVKKALERFTIREVR